jgi:5-formyltetrahydrofolate cyclo-ligase
VNTKPELRRSLQAQRRALPPSARDQAARALARHLGAQRWLAPGRRVGLYASLPHELGTAPLIELARERGCEIFLPRITSLRSRRMQFVPLDHDSAARGRIHALGMHEPWSTEFFPARFLDTIFVPCLALDRRGARLGHGAGFYDRALAFRRSRAHWRGPRLVGLAYSFQVLPEIPVQPTDVFMDVLATDKGIYEVLADEDRAVDVRHR